MPVQAVDVRRAYRFAIGYLDGDPLALDAVLREAEAGAQPQTMRALVIALAELCTTILVDGARGDEATARAALQIGLGKVVEASIERGEDIGDSLGDDASGA